MRADLGDLFLLDPKDVKLLNKTDQLENDQLENIELENIVDTSRESFQPWPQTLHSGTEANCSNYKNHFAQKGTFLPTVWLPSYPGSGNTWLRYLIEGTTGFFTRGQDPIV